MLSKTPAPALRRKTLFDRHPGEGSDMPGTFLAIPYFPGDRGRPGVDRPLGTKAVSYLCPGIIVNGTKGSNTFERGVPTTVTVDVVNSGSGTTVAPVQVALWWCDPTTGFTKLNLFGQAVVPVPTDGMPRTSPVMTNIIPTTAPAHVCLLARVSSPFDAPAAGSPIVPADDRHWAQLNLNAIAVAIGQSFHFLFFAGNPEARTARFDIVVRQAQEDTLPLLARHLHIDPFRAFDIQLGLEDRRLANYTQHSERLGRLQVELRAGERRPITVTGVMPRDVEPGRSVVVEILQFTTGEDTPSKLVGSIGLVVTARKGA